MSCDLQKEAFIKITLLNTVEEQFNLDSISKEVYLDNVNKLLKSYKAISKQIPKFNLDNFCQVRLGYFM